MKQKRSGFWTFFIACIPGAGQMFLGFFKEGISLMVLFFGLLGLADWLYVDALHYLNVVIWFYAFFDTLNKNSLPDEEFSALEDHYFFVESAEEFQGFSLKKYRNALAVVLIFLGLYLLSNNIISILASFGFVVSYELHQLLTHYLPQMVVSVLVIAAGIYLMVGKRASLEDPEQDRYLDGGGEQ